MKKLQNVLETKFMEEREKLVFGDKTIYPTEDLIFLTIAEKKEVWKKIMNYAKENYHGVTEEWRYYNDGKQWLFKLQYKKKTIFWIGILRDTFRITFYFGNKAESLIMKSALPEKMKSDFASGERFGKIRPISIRVSGPSDLDNIYKLIDLKASIK